MSAVLSAAAGLVLAQAYACPAIETEGQAFAEAILLEQSQQYCPDLHLLPGDLSIIAGIEEAADRCGGRWPAFFAAVERQARAEADGRGQRDGVALCRDLSIRSAR